MCGAVVKTSFAKVLISLWFVLSFVGLGHTEQLVEKLHTFVPGTPAKASEVNENFGMLYEETNRLSREIEALKFSAENALAIAILKDAYIIAQTYFSKHPVTEITTDKLKQEGYVEIEDVTMTIESGTMDMLSMKASHVNTGRVYSVDKDGNITPNDAFSNLASTYAKLVQQIINSSPPLL